jgi:hypothetical protein
VASFLGVAVGSTVTLVVPPLGVGVSVAFSAWATALNRHALVVQRVVRDPPDPQFRSATYVTRPRFNVQVLAKDEFGSASVPALAALLESTSLASAMIRALERAQGAALAGEQPFEEERFSEATRHAQSFGLQLQTFTDSTTPVIEAVRSLPSIPQLLPRGGRLVNLLSDSALAELYEMRVPRSDLDIPVMERVNADPRTLFNNGLEELASVTREYAALLRDSLGQAFAGTAA